MKPGLLKESLNSRIAKSGEAHSIFCVMGFLDGKIRQNTVSLVNQGSSKYLKIPILWAK
jgi:hypothetical protein